MPILSNARHERFAQGLAQGKTEERAYEDAGYKPDRSNANKLTTNHHIVHRKAEILEAVQQRTEVTLESLTDMLKEAYAVAKKQDSGGQMTQAAMGMAKLHGLETDPRKNARTPLADVLDMIDGLSRGVPADTRH